MMFSYLLCSDCEKNRDIAPDEEVPDAIQSSASLIVHGIIWAIVFSVLTVWFGFGPVYGFLAYACGGAIGVIFRAFYLVQNQE